MINWGWEGTNSAAKIQKFMEALEEEPNRGMKDFFLTCLYTGARCGNVLSIRWEDMDFSINEWRIPDTKNGEPVKIPLINESLEILG
jgi:integrase